MSSEIDFKKDRYGFWRQVDPRPFIYTDKYKAAQQTTEAMVYLRMGFLMSALAPDLLATMRAVDIGSGNGSFVRTAGHAFKELKPYDLAGESISKEELETTEWNLICLTDVLEHMHDINDLFKLKWKFCYISIPETPRVNDWRELKGWRHYKPDEHIWMLNMRGVCDWLREHDCVVLRTGDPEDMIRKPQPGISTNISTIVAVKIDGAL